jgi:hypothetical protein
LFFPAVIGPFWAQYGQITIQLCNTSRNHPLILVLFTQIFVLCNDVNSLIQKTRLVNDQLNLYNESGTNRRQQIKTGTARLKAAPEPTRGS